MARSPGGIGGQRPNIVARKYRELSNASDARDFVGLAHFILVAVSGKNGAIWPQTAQPVQCPKKRIASSFGDSVSIRGIRCGAGFGTPRRPLRRSRLSPARTTSRSSTFGLM